MATAKKVRVRVRVRVSPLTLTRTLTLTLTLTKFGSLLVAHVHNARHATAALNAVRTKP